MEKLEIVIGVLLLCLVALGVYAVTSWTLSRKKRRDADDDPGREKVSQKYLEEEAENARKKVATAYAQETMPRITITPVQPRPDFPRVRDVLLTMIVFISVMSYLHCPPYFLLLSSYPFTKLQPPVANHPVNHLSEPQRPETLFFSLLVVAVAERFMLYP